MGSVFDVIALAARSFGPVLLDMAVQGTILLALAGVVAFAWRRGRAAARHLVWSLALFGLLLLPLFAALTPRLHAPLFSRGEEEPARPSLVRGFAESATLAELPSAGALAGARADQRDAQPSEGNPALAALSAATEPSTAAVAAAPVLPMWTWALAAWLVGVAWFCLPLLLGLWSIRWLRRSATQVTSGPLATEAASLACRLGIRRTVTLLLSDARAMPMTWGLLRPVVHLPLEAEDWSPERRRAVLLHELAHVRRWDCLTQVMAQLARALHWFNPLVWLASARLQAEQERACDDMVLHAGSDALDYAEHLLAVTAGSASGRLLSSVALGMGKARRIERRLQAILDRTQDRRALPRGAGGLAALALFGLLVPLAALSFQSPATAGPAVAAAASAEDAPPPDETQKQLGDVRARIEQRYVKPVDPRQLSEGAIRGMLEALHDPYCEYISPEQRKDLEQQLAGVFAGIGAQLQLKEKQLTVITPLDDSPALKAGLRPGDAILAIDGKPTEGVALAQAVRQILGAPGSSVKLKIRHADGGEAELAITRARIKVPSVEGFRRGAGGRWELLLDSENKIGYFQISQFGAGTANEVRDALRALTQQKVKGLILDLRFCPGGLLEQAFETTKLFLARGTIVTVKGNDNKETTYKADGQALAPDLPLLVLIDEQTASAAEIVAGALKDNDRATLLGSRSYGKGSVQEIIKLGDDLGAVKLTSAYYYLPSGRNISRHPGDKTWGVDPTDGYYVPLSGSQLEAVIKGARERALLGARETPAAEKVTPEFLRERYSDPQLGAALKTMQARVTNGSFIKVGESNAALAAQLALREDLRKQREELRKNLEKIDRELEQVDRAIGKPEK